MIWNMGLGITWMVCSVMHGVKGNAPLMCYFLCFSVFHLAIGLRRWGF